MGWQGKINDDSNVAANFNIIWRKAFLAFQNLNPSILSYTLSILHIVHPCRLFFLELAIARR